MRNADNALYYVATYAAVALFEPREDSDKACLQDQAPTASTTGEVNNLQLHSGICDSTPPPPPPLGAPTSRRVPPDVPWDRSAGSREGAEVRSEAEMTPLVTAEVCLDSNLAERTWDGTEQMVCQNAGSGRRQ